MLSKYTQTPKQFELDPEVNITRNEVSQKENTSDGNLRQVMPKINSSRNNLKRKSLAPPSKESSENDSSEMVTNPRKNLRRSQEVSQVCTTEPNRGTINHCAHVLPRQDSPPTIVVNKARKSFPPKHGKTRIILDALNEVISKKKNEISAANYQATPARLGQDSEFKTIKETSNARPNVANTPKNDMLVMSSFGNYGTRSKGIRHGTPLHSVHNKSSKVPLCPASASARTTIAKPKKAAQRKPAKGKENIAKEDLLVLSTFGTYRCGNEPPVATRRKGLHLHQVNDNAQSMAEILSAATRLSIHEGQVHAQVNNSARAPTDGLQYKPTTSKQAQNEDILVLSTLGTYRNQNSPSQLIHTSTSNPVEPSSATQSSNKQSNATAPPKQDIQSKLSNRDSAEANRPKKEMPTLLLITKDMVFLPS